MSWQAYVDDNLVASGMVTAAGIYDLQGNPWAYSAGFDAQVAEVAAVCAHFAEPSGLTATGAMVNGVKYMYLRGEENDNVYVRKGATGVHFYKCATCVLVAFHDEGIPRGKCEDAVRNTADYLREREAFRPREGV